MSGVDNFLNSTTGTTAGWQQKSGSGKFLYLFQLILGCGISAFLLWAGLHYKDTDTYPCNKPIAMWLFATGVTGLAVVGLMLIQVMCFLTGTEAGAFFGLCIAIIQGLSGLWSLVWFILGNVWVFGTNATDCPADDGTLFKIGFWYLIAVYILMGLGCVLACLIACCCASKMASSGFASSGFRSG